MSGEVLGLCYAFEVGEVELVHDYALIEQFQ